MSQSGRAGPSSPRKLLLRQLIGETDNHADCNKAAGGHRCGA